MKDSPAGSVTPRVPSVSPFASPSVLAIESRSSVLDLDSPAKFSKYSPISIFYRGGLPPSSDRMRKLRTVEESPLSRSYRDERGHKRSISDLTDDWLSEVPVNPGNDPFASIWSTVNDTKAFGCTEAVSPVLRSTSSLPSNVGLGIGLLDPFTLSGDKGVPSSGSDSDFDGLSSYPPVNDDSVDQPDTPTLSDKENLSTVSRESTPPTKKRRKNID